MIWVEYMCSSLVPRPCPAFRHLQATESWAGPGNEATCGYMCSALFTKCLTTTLKCLQVDFLHCFLLEGLYT